MRFRIFLKNINSGLALRSESIDDYNKKVRDNFIQSILSWVISRGKRLRPFKIVLYVMHLGKIPGIRRIIPWLNPNKNCINYLPVNVSLESKPSIVLPRQVAHDIIDKASVHILMNECGCRLLGDCKNHRHDIGCIFMGESAYSLPHGVSRRITRQEAHDHVKKGIEDGLIPMIGKVSIDNFIYMTPDRRKLIAICFCCPCCCILRSYKYVPGDYLDGIIEPIDGLKIEVTDKCTGCGTCIDTCPFNAIKVIDGKALHTSTCRGCGRCETFCPEKAVTIKIINKNFAEDIKNRINSYVDY
jgi:UDP-glucose 4-epimerase